MQSRSGAGVLTRVGVGLRAPHVREVLATRPATGWFEVHAENYFDSAPSMRELELIRCEYDISLHGVGLSLGSAAVPDRNHLRRLNLLIERLNPCLISEHLAWSAWEGDFFNDLLPLPYTDESLADVCRNVDLTQTQLRQRILLENPSAYLRFLHSTIPEADFLNEIAHRTGCGLLCDINNLYVNSRNIGIDAHEYLERINAPAVSEIHLAGHCSGTPDDQALLIDNHGGPVAQPVWDLYAYAVSRFGTVPTLIEWDHQLPTLTTLLGEADYAAAVAASCNDGI
jgi:uncharacterized protein